MDYKSLIEGILKFSIGTISIAAVIIFVSKSIFNKLIDGIILNYQSQLNKKLEEFKITNQKTLEENKIIFSKLHEDRAEVIKELYGLLIDVEEELNNYKFYINIKTNNLNDSKIESAHKKLNDKLIPEFHLLIYKNKIYFSDEIWNAMCDVDESIYIIFALYCEKRDEDTTIQKAGYELISDAEKDILELKKYLEIEFRKLLGTM
ncbi:hypothetical protein [Clostridium beijerinckii]|uniref:hypothetical protein n=1 Tax=Clostridium beijerinckii TaxID=1520 RepID=UPI000809A763|nr:hypothetical protein [Clostridium beijerinckii]OCA99394.1 hypothetical protein BGS1_09115 [Clostridium beijerinckii]